MPLDPYAPCPAGTGKKLKFCCADLTGELETIDRMIEGDQRLACVEHIEKLQMRYPGRPCLLTAQAILLIELGRHEEAKRVVESVLSAAPANPVALAQSALLSLEDVHLATAIETLQRSIANSPTPMPAAVVDVIAGVAEMLVALGQVPAALGHLLLVASLSANDERTLALILRLNGSAQVPLLFKEEPDLRSAPQDAPWRDRLDEALEPARRGVSRECGPSHCACAANARFPRDLAQSCRIARGLPIHAARSTHCDGCRRSTLPPTSELRLRPWPNCSTPMPPATASISCRSFIR